MLSDYSYTHSCTAEANKNHLCLTFRVLYIIKLVLALILINILLRKFFHYPNYVSVVCGKIIELVKELFKELPLICLFYFVFYQKIYGNIFYFIVPTLNYINTVHFRLSYFIPVVIILLIKEYVNFVKHLIPYGAPLWLFIVLPVIEFFRFLIRPLTLCIRLSTNLCAGHIIIYILSNFALNLEIPNISIHMVVSALTLLEFVISILQAYIFCRLIVLYYEEV